MVTPRAGAITPSWTRRTSHESRCRRLDPFDFEHVDEAENTNPGGAHNVRATCWETHPVTSIKVLDGPPAGAMQLAPSVVKAFQQAQAEQSIACRSGGDSWRSGTRSFAGSSPRTSTTSPRRIVRSRSSRTFDGDGPSPERNDRVSPG
jgi:hypothetical protein